MRGSEASDAHAGALAALSDGPVVRDGFLSGGQVGALVRCLRLRRQAGEFAPARIGRGANLVRRAEIRGDETCWMAEPLHAAEQDLARRFEVLRLELNAHGYFGLFDIELHYARYPVGARYLRHRDQPQGDGARLVSSVLYLNEEWSPGWGGALRLYGASGEWTDLAPLPGRLVLFLSSREHEVLPAYRERLSLTGWFRRRA